MGTLQPKLIGKEKPEPYLYTIFLSEYRRQLLSINRLAQNQLASQSQICEFNQKLKLCPILLVTPFIELNCRFSAYMSKRIYHTCIFMCSNQLSYISSKHVWTKSLIRRYRGSHICLNISISGAYDDILVSQYIYSLFLSIYASKTPKNH